ncbi:MAG TPA: adenylate/guanylate cyclase domain-containing protein [Acidimicrobiales bacterium]|jgi:class 3 adenylate cyclase|nr:adenylate/guanylate cyclase domain-containing protein [Acidimicrobiales bacterium]
MTDALEPRPEANPVLPDQGLSAQRVSDAERDQTVTLLREHVVVGRLTLDEFSERVGLALQARTQGDLESAMGDLPAVAEPEAETLRRRSRRHFVAIMSGASAKGRWRVGAKTTAVAIMGGCEIDLRQAEIDGPEVVITAVAFWGGVEIIVPEGFEVELEGFAFMGGRDLKLKNVPRVPGSPRIRIRGFAVMGGIDIKSKPNRTGRELGQSIVDRVLTDVHTSLTAGTAAGAAPIDIAELGRDIREQMRAQRDAIRQSSRDLRRAEPRRRDEPVAAPAAPAETPSGPREGTVTILFSDMVDYAGMTERLGDQASRELLRDHHQIVRSALEQHGGREIKVQGDGFMVAFGGVARALRCAADMQRAFDTYSGEHVDQPIQVHIGVHTGEAMEEDADFLGHTVIVASRIADVAQSGEILVSGLSAQLVERTEEFVFTDYRAVTLKGLTRPQQVATMVWGE